ncbi:MAG TPA: 4-hydroxythreonine-4-phosphate dehydrogenase PdxA [Chthoniobacterales bacterium]|nr:4-hydroxythreonine-4-phosphate dehydrogenase PdxA [Chthoniobacterales bacterium]
MGEATIETSRAAAAALEEAVTLARRGKIDAVATGPIHKARMYEAGFRFPGQTEFFADRCGVKNFAMCLTGGKITVVLVTAHIPLSEVPRALKQSEIVRVGLLLVDFLQSRSSNPLRVAVAGLNPHAGESGKIGREEIEIIAPAISELNSSHVTRHTSFPVLIHPIPSFTAQSKANSMPCFACITIKD